MRVALVHDHLTQYGGAERVFSALCDLFPDASIFTLLADPALVREHFPARRVITSFLQRVPFARNNHRLFAPLMPQAVETFDFSDHDLVISSSASIAKGVITGPRTLHVCYCHTPLRYAWDDTHRYQEEFRSHPVLLRKFAPLFLHYFRVWDRAAALRPDVFVANSNFVRDRIKKYYGRDATVIYPPVALNPKSQIPNPKQKQIQDSKFQIPDPYFLMVGRLVPYKRFDLAVEAFNELGVPLVIAGSGPEEKRLKQMARRNIRFAGYVPDNILVSLYEGAQALVFPQVEDFGIVTVEAMAQGTPVIAFRAGGALETVEEGNSGIFFDAQTKESLCGAVRRFRKEDFDRAVIRQRVQHFSEERFTQEMSKFIEEQYQAFTKESRI